jgi:HEAT repeat protein
MSQQQEYVLQIDRILQKLEQVRSRQLTCYGSDSHGFHLKAPLAEAEVQAFEAKQQIRLPEDYRIFLTRAGNGGAGPYNGIFPLKEWEDFADWVVDDRPETFLTLPSPLYPEMSRTEDWKEKLREASPYDISPYQGTLSLGSQGCSYAMQLIVSGSCRGRVVYVDADHSPPYVVHETNFLSWYERWLDELLQGYNIGWFGYGPGGGEEDFFQILTDPQASDEFKTEAALAFCRLPHLSDKASAQIAKYLEHPLAGVRTGALTTIQRFQLSQCLSQAEQRLEDSSAEVRKQAVKTVMGLDPQRSTEAVLHRLRSDADENVARVAFHALKDAKALTKTELLQLLNDPTRRSLHGFVTGSIAWSTEDVPLLIRLLENSDRSVRSSAVQGLKQIQGKSSLPHLLKLLSDEKDVYLVGHILKALGELEEPSSVPVLLEWVTSSDDFHRLEAMEALAKIGDERAVMPALAMLQEKRSPERRSANGSGQSHVRTISELVSQYLKESPNQDLRRLAV